MIVNASLEFTTDDIANWRSFLDTQTGQRLLPKLAEAAPILLDGENINQTLVRNGELRGFQLALKTLLELTEIPSLPPAPIEAYPALENDSAWNDNKKTT